MNITRLRFSLLLTACLLALSACGGAEESGPTAVAEAPPPMVEVDTGAEDCVLDPPAEPMACTMQYDPVCGCDGKTYGNACMAGGAGVPRFEPGACEDGED